MRVVNTLPYHNRISAKADTDYRRVSNALCVPSAEAPFQILDMNLDGFGLIMSWNNGNPSRVFNASEHKTERLTCDQSHFGVTKGRRCPKVGQM